MRRLRKREIEDSTPKLYLYHRNYSTELRRSRGRYLRVKRICLLARDAFVRMSRRAITMMFVRPSVCLSVCLSVRLGPTCIVIIRRMLGQI